MQILLPSGHDLYENARVTLQSLRGVKLSVYTDNQGRFQFQSLAAGNYEVIIEPNNDLYEVTSAKVEVFPGLPH